ncbi:MAG: hypothetical protein ABH858_00620 [Candidatus Omnitrophota bacterium]
MMDYKIVKVVFPIGVDKEFDYLLSEEMACEEGMRVAVEFNRQQRVGVVVSLCKQSRVKNIKPVIKTLDNNPSLTPEHLQFARSISKYYLYPWGEIVFMMLPPYLREKRNFDIFPSGIYQYSGEHREEFIKKEAFRERSDLYRERALSLLKTNSIFICFPLVSHLEEFYKSLDENFQEKTVIFHSYQPPKQNFQYWCRLRRGKLLILGTRAAIFYFPADLGLVIVEEEASSYYFQPEKPFYHLVDVARLLCRFKKIPLLLSGDYPSLATYRRCKAGKVGFYDDKEYPKSIKIFDLKEFYYRQRGIFTPLIIELMRKILAGGKKVFLVWSKENFSTIMRCANCGHIVQCRRCSSFLKFSLAKQVAICSSCGYKEAVKDICPVCTTGYIKPIGVGVERLETIVKDIFPEMEIRQLEKAQESTNIILTASKIINSVLNLPFDIGACFLLDIDNLLSKIDYEATFHAFLYIKKAAMLTNGPVYVFSHYHTHYLWEDINGRWQLFYDKELFLRKKLKFPPYGNVVKITLRAKDKNILIKKAQSLYNRLKEENLDAFGPIEEVPFKLRDMYRHSVVIKIRKRKEHIKDIEAVINQYRKSVCKLAVIIK